MPELSPRHNRLLEYYVERASLIRRLALRESSNGDGPSPKKQAKRKERLRILNKLIVKEEGIC